MPTKRSKLRRFFDKLAIIIILISLLLIVVYTLFVLIYRDVIIKEAQDVITDNFATPLLSQILLMQLFKDNFKRNADALIYIGQLKEYNFRESELELLIEFLTIKQDLIKYKVQFGNYPEMLSQLGLSRERITDEWGNYYHYLVQGKYILLGSRGSDGVWSLNDSAKASIYQNMQEFVYKVGDDFIIKIIPDGVN